jgi:hypothetical protein
VGRAIPLTLGLWLAWLGAAAHADTAPGRRQSPAYEEEVSPPVPGVRRYSSSQSKTKKATRAAEKPSRVASYTFSDGPQASETQESEPAQRVEAPVEGDLLHEGEHYHEPMYWDEPAPAVSSGEWLKNGPWYTQQSAVYMNRSTNVKNSIILSVDLSSSQLLPHYRNFLQIPLDLGYEPGMRSTIGRVLGRDDRNRNHAVEFTFTGLTHWQTAGSMTAVQPGGIFVDILLDPSFQVPVFNAADHQTMFESSNLNTYEFNYRIDRRLPRDRVVYSRDSTWVRQADPAPLPSVLAGLRVAFNNESLNWFSQSSDGTGTYHIVTHNNMVGPQVGVEWFYERGDWRLGARGKTAAVVNWADESTRVRILNTAGAPLQPNRDEDAENHVLGFIGEINAIGVYHLSPHFALRFTYDIMFITNQALAQNQVTFAPTTPPSMSMGHSLLYQGVSFGFEYVH